MLLVVEDLRFFSGVLLAWASVPKTVFVPCTVSFKDPFFFLFRWTISGPEDSDWAFVTELPPPSPFDVVVVFPILGSTSFLLSAKGIPTSSACFCMRRAILRRSLRSFVDIFPSPGLTWPVAVLIEGLREAGGLRSGGFDLASGPRSELRAELEEEDEVDEELDEELESELEFEAVSLDDEDEEELVDAAGLGVLALGVTEVVSDVGRFDPPFSDFLFFDCPISLELLLFLFPNSCFELPALSLTLRRKSAHGYVWTSTYTLTLPHQ